MITDHTLNRIHYPSSEKEGNPFCFHIVHVTKRYLCQSRVNLMFEKVLVHLSYCRRHIFIFSLWQWIYYFPCIFQKHITDHHGQQPAPSPTALSSPTPLPARLPKISVLTQPQEGESPHSLLPPQLGGRGSRSGGHESGRASEPDQAQRI